MLKNYKEIHGNRYNLSEKDYEFFICQTGLSRKEIDDIFTTFEEQGFSL
jgi:hypothetical protein